ncbi:MAG: PAS domain-containing hybrid sensor histidine kinase/response regulator [Opitutales bacterium]
MEASDHSDGEFAELTRTVERLKAQLDMVSDLLLTLNKEGVVEALNDQGHRLLGYNEGELVGKDWIETCVPDKSREEVRKLFEDLIAGNDETREGHVTQLKRRDGSHAYVSWRNALIRDDSGEAIGMFATGRDISKRTYLNTALRKTESVVRNMASSVVITDVEGIIEYANPAACRITGYEMGELIGRHTRMFGSGKQSKAFYREMWSSIKDQNVWRGMMQNKRKDGSLYWESAVIYPVIDDNGKTINYLAIKDDISDQMEKELELELLSETLKNSEFAVVFSDAKRQVESVNPAFTTLTGYAPQDLVGRRISDVLSGAETDAEALKTMEQVEQSGNGYAGDLLCYNANKEAYWAHVQIAPIRLGQSKEITHFVEFHSLVTDRVMAQKGLELRGLELEAANNAKNEFLSVMSHELRTPLNPIIGMSELMLMNCEDEEQRQSLNIIMNAGNHLLSLITDILDFGKIESGNMTFKMEVLRLEPLLANCVNLTATQIQTNRVEFQTCFDNCDEVSVLSDSLRLKQVVLNLLTNAFKFTDSGTVKLYCEQMDDNICIHVEDTGIGIPEDKISSIFDAFYQLDSSHTRKYEGTGLGLSISKKIIDRLGGEIRVKSMPGAGSRFTVILPMHHEARPIADESLSIPNVEFAAESFEVGQHCSLESKEVLIVEDNESNTFLLKKLFTKMGFSFDLVSDGDSALSHLRKYNYQLVFLDLQLPDISGYEICEQIRSNQETAQLYVIAQTAQVDFGVQEDCIKRGFDAYISKPYDRKKLEALLTKIIK